jgi:uncharacterized lipoprotein YmbA
MSIAPASCRLIAAAFAFLIIPAGCSTAPSAKLYTLAARPAPPVADPAKTISVRHVEIAKYLERPQIVRYLDPYQIDALEFDRWGEELGDMVTRVVVADLALRLPGSEVYAATGPLTLPRSDITIEINIDKFDADPGGAVVLAAQWVVHGGKHRDKLRSEQIRVATTSNDATAQVAAMSDALGQLANLIAASLAS